MASVYARSNRGNTLWMRVREGGRWVSRPTKYVVGQEHNARRYAERVQHNIDAAEANGEPVPQRLTVREYFKQWLKTRIEADLDWKHDDARMRHHVLPKLGSKLLLEVRPIDLVNLFRGLRQQLAPRTVRNVYSVVSAMFRDARLADVIDQTPCILDERQLGPVVDKDPEWRESAVYARNEVEKLISDDRIDWDQRVHYALQFLGGLRHGEVSALRWCHHDPTRKPLGRLLVATSYSTEKRRTKRTKTDVVRHIPVHPVLAAVLAEWRLKGWAAMMGRPPSDEDLILPLRPEHIARRRVLVGDAHRDSDYSYKRWKADLETLKLRHRRGHDARATFITLCLDDGADERVIERITHTPKSRSAFGLYNRGRQWEAACAEVAKLKISRRTGTGFATGFATSLPILVGKQSASGGTRTPTTFRSTPPKDAADTSFATLARRRRIARSF